MFGQDRRTTWTVERTGVPYCNAEPAYKSSKAFAYAHAPVIHSCISFKTMSAGLGCVLYKATSPPIHSVPYFGHAHIQPAQHNRHTVQLSPQSVLSSTHTREKPLLQRNGVSKECWVTVRRPQVGRRHLHQAPTALCRPATSSVLSTQHRQHKPVVRQTRTRAIHTVKIHTLRIPQQILLSPYKARTHA